MGEFDAIMGVNARGLWLCAREELARIMAQEPLPTHDGRPGCRGSVVNISSNLALVSTGGAGASPAAPRAQGPLTPQPQPPMPRPRRPS